jgi:hypothetical protein
MVCGAAVGVAVPPPAGVRVGVGVIVGGSLVGVGVGVLNPGFRVGVGVGVAVDGPGVEVGGPGGAVAVG